MTTFEAALERTLKHEGGWYDGSGAHDPNPTMKGVTQKVYDKYRLKAGLPAQTVKKISQAELLDIYATYWEGAPACLSGIGASMSAAILFDHAVNAGPKAAVRVLQRALNVMLAGSLVDDGLLGQKTARAISLVWDDPALARLILTERLVEYVRIAKRPNMRPNLLSWTNRLTTFYTECLR